MLYKIQDQFKPKLSFHVVQAEEVSPQDYSFFWVERCSNEASRYKYRLAFCNLNAGNIKSNNLTSVTTITIAGKVSFNQKFQSIKLENSHQLLPVASQGLIAMFEEGP